MRRLAAWWRGIVDARLDTYWADETARLEAAGMQVHREGRHIVVRDPRFDRARVERDMRREP